MPNQHYEFHTPYASSLDTGAPTRADTDDSTTGEVALNTVQYTLGELDTKRSSYTDDVEHLSQIRTLFQGGRTIELQKRQYLKQRLDESSEEYSKRLERFVYTNTFGYAVQRLLSKFATGEVHVTGYQTAQEDDWATLRESVGVGDTGERLLLQDLLRDLIVDGSVWLRADRPASPVAITNRAQERALGLTPYLVSYSPLEVLSSGPGWVKLRRFTLVAQPFGPSHYEATWELLTEATTTTFSLDVLLNAQGEIKSVVSSDGTTRPYSKSMVVPGYVVEHGFGRLPIVHVALSPEAWAGNQVRLKALQQLEIENALTDTAVSAGYVQRVLTPLDTTESLTEVAAEDYAPSSNANVYMAKSFNFAEIAGTSITVVRELLATIASEIRSAVQVTGASVDKGALERSAASKYADREELSLALIGYGQIVTAAYQSALQIIAPLLDTVPSDVAVTGLDTFELDNLSELLEVGEKLAGDALESRLSPRALHGFYQKLGNQLSHNSTAAQRLEVETTTPVPTVAP